MVAPAGTDDRRSPGLRRCEGNRTEAASVLLVVFTVYVLLLLLTLVTAAVWMLRRVRQPSPHVAPAPVIWVLAAGWVLLPVLTVAASFSLLPFQLDDAGRQACAITRSGPAPEQREEAVALAGSSDEGGLREAAGPATPPSQRYSSVERWCSSND